MRYVVIVVSFFLLAFGANAQTTNFQSDGNLAPTHNVKCVALRDVKNQYTPADLAVAVVRCGKQKEYDRAVELLRVLLLRAAYDTKRVEDRSAHQAGRVLALQVNTELGKSRMSKIQAASVKFGGSETARHKIFCAEQKRTGPPDYHPTYMIQHGMSAFTGQKGNGIIKGFRPQKAWRELLANYMKCG